MFRPYELRLLGRVRIKDRALIIIYYVFVGFIQGDYSFPLKPRLSAAFRPPHKGPYAREVVIQFIILEIVHIQSIFIGTHLFRLLLLLKIAGYLFCGDVLLLTQLKLLALQISFEFLDQVLSPHQIFCRLPRAIVPAVAQPFDQILIAPGLFIELFLQNFFNIIKLLHCLLVGNVPEVAPLR